MTQRKTMGFVATALVLMVVLGGFFSFLPMARGEDSFQDPYAVNGVVYDESDNPVVGATVEVENLRTDETVTTTTNEYGEYIVALNSMASGYRDGDSIRITATKGALTGSATDEVDVTSFHTEVDVTLGEEEEEEDRGLFLGLAYWVWILIVVGIIIVGLAIYFVAKKDELGMGK